VDAPGCAGDGDAADALEGVVGGVGVGVCTTNASPSAMEATRSRTDDARSAWRFPELATARIFSRFSFTTSPALTQGVAAEGVAAADGVAVIAVIARRPGASGATF
jgi:hypothetical protein